MNGGCAKNAPNPPQPSTARPMKSALETTAIEAIRRCLPSMMRLILTDLPPARARNPRFGASQNLFGLIRSGMPDLRPSQKNPRFLSAIRLVRFC
jgi:hypothetical protein